MNKKILSAALTIMPKSIQAKAVAKGLNFLLPLAGDTQQLCIQLELVDLKRSWQVEKTVNGYTTSSKKRPAAEHDVVIKATLPVVLACKDSRRLRAAVNSGDIELLGCVNGKEQIAKQLLNISQQRLDTLVEQCYKFFKLKPQPRIDISSVTLSDIQLARDVDFIRDEAVRLEKNNLQEALRLMEIAHQARPNGPFIKRKLDEYRQALAS
ncbi:hypothetical protein [Psychromonas sp.]|uniref:hypothetical protein n=1 Tax=Psychromonas sp. TaxID=1884585 RepID=UPI003A97BD0E